MADYKGIQGYTVQSLSEDPATASEVTGQLWYNSGSGKFKVGSTGAGAWASGTATPSSSVYGKCTRSPASSLLLVTENTQKYDGTSWTELNNLQSGRNRGGCAGTITAALYYGGNPTSYNTYTESWDGTNWSEVNDLNTGKQYFAQTGTQTAAISAGGEPSQGITEIWNGTSWTEDADLNTPRSTVCGCKNGTSTAFLIFGGYSASPPPASVRALTESFNGTSWTELNDLNTARDGIQGAGTQSLAQASGGAAGPPGATAVTEQWDGSSWTEVADMATARYQAGGCGTTSGAFVGGGVGATTTVEEWSDPTYTIKTVTVS